MSLLQSQRQGLRSLRDHQQMHVAGHQTVAEQEQRVELEVLPQEVEIHAAFGVGGEQELTRITALCDGV